ncbi:MAG: transporter substrate-binding domain-containing protein [Castellaniella sp.]|nr:MAG: transporter substrate-binding domain-containing protein [Castellaniella sp.]
MKILYSAVAVALCAASASSSALELDQIKQAGEIRIAINEGLPTYSFLGADLKPDGSDIAAAKLLAKDLGVKLKLVSVSTAARIPTIQTGKADITVAALSITPERSKVVDFSIPYSMIEITVAAPKEVKITGYKDLKGVTIGLTRATTNDADISKNAPDANIRRYEDDATLVTAAVSHQVKVVSSNPAIMGEINKKLTKDPFETKFVEREFELGVALPKNNPKLKAWLDQWVRTNLKNGKLNDIYKQYHDGRGLSENILKGGA